MKSSKALIIDDEPDIRELLTITLEGLGLAVSQASNTREALDMIARTEFDLCLTDMRLPDGDGLEIVDAIQTTSPRTPVAVITAHGNTELAVSALKRGAFDFVSKPVELKRLRSMVETALELRHDDANPKPQSTGLVGTSAPMENLRNKIARVARSQAPVFISGESGSGKELVARAIHYRGPRSNGAFIAVNCGAIPGELMESEFFGHRKGSFTGAIQDKQGLFQAAHGGTLFLDEVADLPLNMQVKLLRALQEGEVDAVGSRRPTKVDVRIISATNKDLAEQVKSGGFREDLYYRLNVFPIDMPSLRERKDDVPALVEHFISRFNASEGLNIAGVSEETLQVLCAYDWPGNVRQLENAVFRAMILCEGSELLPHDFPQISGVMPEMADLPPVPQSAKPANDASEYSEADSPVAIKDGAGELRTLSEIERDVIEYAIDFYQGHMSEVSRRLGIGRSTLYRKLREYELEPEEKKAG